MEHCLVQETWPKQQENEERTATHKGKLGLGELCSIWWGSTFYIASRETQLVYSVKHRRRRFGRSLWRGVSGCKHLKKEAAVCAFWVLCQHLNRDQRRLCQFPRVGGIGIFATVLLMLALDHYLGLHVLLTCSFPPLPPSDCGNTPAVEIENVQQLCWIVLCRFDTNGSHLGGGNLN